jgi:lipopolysaccharide/colanic/teichoic acid biosynthesis glycosyltransferase
MTTTKPAEKTLTEEMAGDCAMPQPTLGGAFRETYVHPQMGGPKNLAESTLGAPRSSSGGDLLSLGGALLGENIRSREAYGAATGHAVLHDHPSLRGLKRGLDVALAGLALLAALPLLLACAVATRLTSKGPLFFYQSRLGQGGKAFSIVKFRSMMINAEVALAEYLEANPEAKREWMTDHKLRMDPRITPVGRFMRKFSLDELPQLWNVVKGEMSLVGPRPIVSSEIPKYGEGYLDYCRVRPGLTGLWQVSGRNDTGYTQRVELDGHYVRCWSVARDLEIIARTLPAVVRSAGAY